VGRRPATRARSSGEHSSAASRLEPNSSVGSEHFSCCSASAAPILKRAAISAQRSDRSHTRVLVLPLSLRVRRTESHAGSRRLVACRGTGSRAGNLPCRQWLLARPRAAPARTAPKVSGCGAASSVRTLGGSRVRRLLILVPEIRLHAPIVDGPDLLDLAVPALHLSEIEARVDRVRSGSRERRVIDERQIGPAWGQIVISSSGAPA
jgi:hypothetical protein